MTMTPPPTIAPELSPEGVATAAGAHVELAGECYRCGYSLISVADEQPCPECGLLAGRSRRPTDELHDSRPGWLRRLSWGVWLILFAVPAFFAWTFLRDDAINLIARLNWRYYANNNWAIYYHSRWIGLDVAAVLLLVGTWLLTGPEGFAPADRADAWRRRALRALVLIFAAAATARHLRGRDAWGNFSMQSWFSPGPPDDHFGVVLFVVTTLFMAPLPMLLFWQLRSLAVRARSAHLAEHSAIVSVGNAFSLAYVGVFGILVEYASEWGLGSYWQSRSGVAMGLITALAVCSLLFALWNAYVLLQFAVAFGRASRKLRSQWRQSDRAAAHA